MKISYAKQPLLIALLVSMLVVVAFVGSFMLYQRTDDGVTPSSTVATAREKWEIYDMHAGSLRFSYPAGWNVKELPDDGDTIMNATVIESPDEKTRVRIEDGVELGAFRIPGQIIDTAAARLAGQQYTWAFVKAASANGQASGAAISAYMLTNATTAASLPVISSEPAGTGVAIHIENSTAPDTAAALQEQTDFPFAKRIAESVRSQ